jgi:hypothetical protein
VTNLNGEFLQPARPAANADSNGQQHQQSGHNGTLTPPFKGTRSLPDHTRRHSLPVHFLPQNLWSANASTASLIETEEAARGEHILDEATVAHRISALRQLNGATRTRHRYAKSTGARNSTFNQPVIVSTYSGMRPQSKAKEPPVKKEIQPMGKAELPPVEAFSFKGIMESIHSGVAEDLERIAEICARSRYSLSNQYEEHMPPHGDGNPFLSHNPGNAGQMRGPTLEAITSDDEQSRPSTRPSRSGRQRTKSMAYGTLETIYSSSKSSEEEKAKKKPAKAIAEEVRGRAAKKTLAVADMPSGSRQDNPAVEEPLSAPPKPNRTRSRSVGFATLLLDTGHGTKGDAASRTIPSAALISEPARPQTSMEEQDLASLEGTATIVSSVMSTLSRRESTASTLKPISDQRPSVFSNLSSWLPWARPLESTLGSNAENVRSPSYAEGSLRQLLKATNGDIKGKGVDRIG